MPLKLALIVVLPVTVSCLLLYAAEVPWAITGRIAAVLAAFLLVTGLCDRLRGRASRVQRLREQELAETAPSIAALPREPAAGLGAAVIAGLPVYKYEKKSCSGGGGDQCAVCLGEIRPTEVVKQLPACTHLFHEGCIDLWLWSHRTCPVCRSPVAAAAAAAAVVQAVEVSVRVQS